MAYSLGVPIAILFLNGKNYDKFEDLKKNRKWLILAIIIPIFYCTVLYLIGQYLLPYTPDPLNKNQNLFFSVLLILISVIFEEIGWRGYLYKNFTSEGWFKMNLAISFFWALWHVPAILYGGLTIADPYWFGLILFFINLTLASFLLGWIRQKTGGILAPTLVHASNNLAMVAFGISGTILSESGLIFTLILLIFFLIIRAWKTPTLFQIDVIKEKIFS